MKNLSIASKIVLIIVLIFSICTGGCTGVKPSSPCRISVLTYNIYHGEDANGNSNLDAVAGIINSLKPDLVALQEVDNKTTRAKGLDLTAELSQRTGMQGIFGKAMDYAGGGYGEAVLTRCPVIYTKNNPLPHTPEAEPRATLEIQIELPTKERIVFVGTHLDHQRDQNNRMQQAGRIKELYLDNDFPIILAGDLNAPPGSDPINLLCEQWSYAAQDDPQPTIPSVNPRRKIDYIMYKPKDRWKVIEVRVIDEKVASDHCPVFAVLELLPDG
ncbi:MAG: endonuclease/exonuclease/phosphatase family protein [Sedimentisphaerales bacterium]|nr:endonuclease/exonuclease/phosphatase family protein [Sedimentisphaerales bacterium]